MARSKYKSDKRQKELSRMKNKEEKRMRKIEKKRNDAGVVEDESEKNQDVPMNGKLNASIDAMYKTYMINFAVGKHGLLHLVD